MSIPRGMVGELHLDAGNPSVLFPGEIDRVLSARRCRPALAYNFSELALAHRKAGGLGAPQFGRAVAHLALAHRHLEREVVVKRKIVALTGDRTPLSTGDYF